MTQPGTPSTPTLTTEDIVRELWDRQQISDVMLRFGRGLDTRDWDMYAATLTDPIEVESGDLTGRPPQLPSGPTIQNCMQFSRDPCTFEGNCIQF